MFRIVSEPIVLPDVRHRAAGGFATFEGRVRDHNDGRDVLGIEYEAFAELAEAEGAAILAEARERFGVLDAQAIHRVGRLEVGDMAVWIGTAAAHRREAFLACEYIIDEIKHRLPIWKCEQYADGDRQWVHCTHGAQKVTEDALYARQQRLPAVGAEGQRRLKDASVLVVGAGGLGAAALPYLAAAGVGRIGICEPDTLAASNLHRQVIYAAADIGQPKALLAAAAMRRLNPLVVVEPHPVAFDRSTGAALAASYDLVIDCTDNFRTRFLLNDVCVAARRPLVQASIYQFEGQLIVTDPAAGSPCLRCLWPEAPDDGCVGTCAEVGVLGVVPGLFGVLQAAEAVKHILNIGERLTGSMLLIDLLTHDVQRIARSRNPQCPCCSGSGVIAPDIEVDVTGDLARYTPVDIREPDEVIAERPPVGVGRWLALPMSEMPDRLRELDPAGSYLLVCARGVRSLRMAKELRARGFADAVSLAGGMAGLQRAMAPAPCPVR